MSRMQSPEMQIAPAELAGAIDVSDERLPLPPGSPISWGAITAGTVLEGAAYVYVAPITRSRRPA